jgi:hypothetical protein
MRLVASEVAFTELGSANVPVGTLQISLRDDRSFLPRLSEGGDWVLGFDRASDPIGSARSLIFPSPRARSASPRRPTW